MTTDEARELFDVELSLIRQHIEDLHSRVIWIDSLMRFDAPEGRRQLERLAEELMR